jgi:hypothetical protein
VGVTGALQTEKKRKKKEKKKAEQNTQGGHIFCERHAFFPPVYVCGGVGGSVQRFAR